VLPNSIPWSEGEDVIVTGHAGEVRPLVLHSGVSQTSEKVVQVVQCIYFSSWLHCKMRRALSFVSV